MWYIYTMEYFSAIKKNKVGSFVETWMDLEIVIQSEVCQKEKNKYCMLTHICGIQKNGMDYLICKALLFLDKMFIVFLISANIRKTLLQENKGDFDVLDRLGLTYIH